MNSLQLQKPIIRQMKIGSFFVVEGRKNKKYYVINDVAIWQKCGHIKTILHFEIIFDKDIKKVKKLKSLIKFTDDDQFIIKHGNVHAIYNLRISHAYQDPLTVSDISIQKIPNLHMCRCGA